jgi:hypothetical protein
MAVRLIAVGIFFSVFGGFDICMSVLHAC